MFQGSGLSGLYVFRHSVQGWILLHRLHAACHRVAGWMWLWRPVFRERFRRQLPGGEAGATAAPHVASVYSLEDGEEGVCRPAALDP